MKQVSISTRVSLARVRRLSATLLGAMALCVQLSSHAWEDSSAGSSADAATPKAFNPMLDKNWLGGYKESFTSEIPEELKSVDALTRATQLERLVACADGWFYPFSQRNVNGQKQGIDLDILQAIADKQGWRVEVVWANTGSFAGIGREFRRGIDKGYCDFFTGLVITGEDELIVKHKLMFTQPYLGMGFTLVLQNGVANVRSLDDIKRDHIKVGVLMFSPMEDFIREHEIEHELYYQNGKLMDGMAAGEVRAAMMWTGAVATLKRDYKLDFEPINGYVPPKGQRWNAAWAVPKKEPELKRFFDEQFAAMIKSGEMKKIVESYGMPFYPPFND